MATLLVTAILLIAATGIVLLSANHIKLEQMINRNEYQLAQATEAAKAGLDFAITNLDTNRTTIVVDANNDGFIDNNSSTGNLANGSSYQISYTNPTASNFDIIRIDAVGYSSGNATQKALRELVRLAPVASSMPVSALTARLNVDMRGSSFIENPNGSSTIQAGGSVTLSGSASTSGTSGTQTIISNKSTLNSDVQTGIASLAGETVDQMFVNTFNLPIDKLREYVDYYYQGSGNYSAVLSGKQDALIWIDKAPDASTNSVTINSNTVIGSPDHPVILVVDGDITALGNATLYGMIYLKNNSTINLSGNFQIHGVVIAGGNINVTGNMQISYDAGCLDDLQKNLVLIQKIPGSWSNL
jgi:hypothetical protein